MKAFVFEVLISCSRIDWNFETTKIIVSQFTIRVNKPPAGLPASAIISSMKKRKEKKRQKDKKNLHSLGWKFYISLILKLYCIDSVEEMTKK